MIGDYSICTWMDRRCCRNDHVRQMVNKDGRDGEKK